MNTRNTTLIAATIALLTLGVAGASSATPLRADVAMDKLAFTRTPVAGIQHVRCEIGGPPCRYIIYVAVRVNQALPRVDSGGVDASINVNRGYGDPPGSVYTLSRFSHCYAEQVSDQFGNAKELDHPHVGQTVTVKLTVGEHIVLSRRVHLRADPTKDKPHLATDGDYARLLGCSSKRPLRSA